MEAATTDVRPVTPAAGLDAIARRARDVYLPQVLGALALLGIVAGTLLIAIAAAQGHSFLTTSLKLHPPHWLTWPFGGLWSTRTNDHRDMQVGLLAALLGMFACYGIALSLARRLHPAIVWGGVAAAYIVCFLAPPLMLTDVFNYIGYARMGVVHHLNPYTHAPVDIWHDPVFKLNNWHHLPSPYGPLFTLGTYALAPLGLAGAYWSYKAAVMVASVGCLVLVWLIARRLGRSPLPAVVLVGMNPVVLVYGTAGQHNDAFVLLFTLAAVYFAISRSEGLGGAAMVGAAAMKASAGILVPITAFGAERRGRALLGTLAGALIFGSLWIAGFGPHIPAVHIQSSLVTPYSIPNMLGLAVGRGGADHAVRTAMEAILAAATIFCSVWAWRRREIIAPLGWLSLISLMTISWAMPWYMLWVLPFIAFVRQRSFRIVAVAVCVWLVVSYLPYFAQGARKVGLNPAHTATWHANSHYTARYLH
jgi:hypothetical protein